MPLPTLSREPRALAFELVKWLCLVTPMAMAVGTACALFLTLLDRATVSRFQHPSLFYLLPFAGAAIGWLYAKVGEATLAGNNLIIDQIHEPGGGVPRRMAPLILFSTLVTHLFGGSAGREGTAVQMGGSLASAWAKCVPGLQPDDVRVLLMAGVAAGFGGVFGTPVAGTVFALEVLVVGRMNTRALWPCLVASLVSDQTCVAWGIQHTHYHIDSSVVKQAGLHLAPLYAPLVGLVAIAGLTFGAVSRLFSELMHRLTGALKRAIPSPVLRPAIGGALLIVLTLLMGTRDYLGLGVQAASADAVTISSSFHAGGAHTWSWFWKLLFTAITLSSGFKGGEVTPLFFIGAALGNSLAVFCGAPIDLFAALGFIAVFAGATKTPIACTVMGIELFGSEYSAYFALACVLSTAISGRVGIYHSQRVE